MNLKVLQEHFAQSLTANLKNEELERLIIPAGSLRNEEALNVYRTDYATRLKEALVTNYEATLLVLGDEDFFSLAHSYVINHPSKLDNLTNYGEHFPEWIKSSSVTAWQMALFEKAFWKCFHQKRQNPLSLTPDFIMNSGFDLSDLTLIASDLRLDLVWQNRQIQSADFEELDLYTSSYFVIYKKYDTVSVEKLSELEFEILDELSKCSKINLISQREISAETWRQVFEIIQFSNIQQS